MNLQYYKNMANTITCVALTLIISLFSISKSNAAAGNGFTTDLIHRDSPQSPTYDPSLSPSQLIANAISRSLHRVQLLDSKLSQKSPLSYIINSGGEYLMNYSIGSPPVPSLGIADTGSDIIWTQCQPCLECFNQTLPVFNPKSSSTYEKIQCSAPICGSTQQTSCSSGSCHYSERYGDGSYTDGDLSRDTLTLASSGGEGAISVPKVLIGCGTQNGGVFLGGESGIVGLGGGKNSLVAQLGPLAQGKLSYCLMPYSERSKSSKLNFGANAVLSGSGVVSTPLVRKEPVTFYFATLLGISFGNQTLEVGAHQEGNMLVDSGTTLTILPMGLYNNLIKAMQEGIKLGKVADPTGVLDLCFATRSDDVAIPDVTVRFKGADLKWGFKNMFIRVSDDVVCFAARPAGNIAIYGSFAQVNFLVGFDLVKGTVSFKPTNCTQV